MNNLWICDKVLHNGRRWRLQSARSLVHDPRGAWGRHDRRDRVQVQGRCAVAGASPPTHHEHTGSGLVWCLHQVPAPEGCQAAVRTQPRTRRLRSHSLARHAECHACMPWRSRRGIEPDFDDRDSRDDRDNSMVEIARLEDLQNRESPSRTDGSRTDGIDAP